METHHLQTQRILTRDHEKEVPVERSREVL